MPEFLQQWKRRLSDVWNDPARRPLVVGSALFWGAAVVLWIYLARGDKPWNLRRVQEGVPMADLHSGDFIVIGLYAAAFINLILCLLVAVTARWWARPMPPAAEIAPEPVRPPKSWRWFWVVLLLAMVVAGGLRWNLAQGSLWWDEAWTLKRAVMGYQAPSEDQQGQLEFHDTGWRDAFWRYQKQTNHIFFSVTSRASLNVWRFFTGAEAWEFNEFWMRLPVFTAALLSVLLIGVLLRDWGFPVAGAAAAVLLAVHPWHIRYGIDARAFSLLVLFTLSGAWFLVRGLRYGRWRDWLGLGASQLLMLWSFPNALYVALGYGVGGLAGWLWLHGCRTEKARIGLGRFLMANLFAAMIFLQLMGPNFAQIPRWGDVGGDWWKPNFLTDLWSQLVLGMPRAIPGDETGEGLTSLLVRIGEVPGLWTVVWILVPAVSIFGALVLLVRPGPIRWAAFGLVTATPLTLLVAYTQDLSFYTRYVIYALPALVIYFVVGVEIAVRAALWKRPAWQRFGVPAAFIFLLAGYLAVTAPQTTVLLTRPYSPVRDVAEKVSAPAGDEPLSVWRAGFGLGGATVEMYDPWVHHIRSRDDLEELLEKVATSGKPLYFYYAYEPFNRHHHPEAFERLDDPDLFEPLETFTGIEADFYYRIFRYRPQDD